MMRIGRGTLRTKRALQAAWLATTGVRLLPHLVVLLASSEREVILRDVARWHGVMFRERRWSWPMTFVVLMTFNPEFRNLFYHRVGLVSVALRWLCPPMSTLFIHTPEIGPGLFIQHGFATIIAARRIGADCWINQQVTIGFTSPDDTPTIGDRVVIASGAKVLGSVTIGDDAFIGANAVVVKSLPSGVTAVGVPARIIKRAGVRVAE
jgi:serine O-acetyltransferase